MNRQWYEKLTGQLGSAGSEYPDGSSPNVSSRTHLAEPSREKWARDTETLSRPCENVPAITIVQERNRDCAHGFEPRAIASLSTNWANAAALAEKRSPTGTLLPTAVSSPSEGPNAHHGLQIRSRRNLSKKLTSAFPHSCPVSCARRARAPAMRTAHGSAGTPAASPAVANFPSNALMSISEPAAAPALNSSTMVHEPVSRPSSRAGSHRRAGSNFSMTWAWSNSRGNLSEDHRLGTN